MAAAVDRPEYRIPRYRPRAGMPADWVGDRIGTQPLIRTATFKGPRQLLPVREGLSHLVALGVRDSRVDHCVLDVRVSHPILDLLDI